MEWIVAVMAVLGGILPLVALYLASSRVRNELARLTAALDKIDDYIADTSMSEQEKQDAIQGTLEPKFNWGRVTYTYEWIQRLILQNALADLRGPVLLTAVGVFFATTASVWSIWLS
ncbi:hypothetical protein DMH04_38120 [Kibdelosporangium aridum]|uniref:Uncharacterized protein n=1 Tax=Kibdelosporangium aridum TaxID=2030 RepID=A0A428YYJ2_KIBAR|nr:hypothetical protein DMH04_38120 [Kibdelosporangium aridum]